VFDWFLFLPCFPLTTYFG
jgi:hypothetical protein